MTAMNQLQAVSEFWKYDTEFTHIEVSNTGRFRNGVTKAPIPVYGSGGKAKVKLVDSHGRRYERNVRRMVRKLFGTVPIRLAAITTPTPEEEQVTTPTTTTEDWVALRWPGVADGYRINREGVILSTYNKVLKGAVQHSPFGDYLVMNLLRGGDNTEYRYLKARHDELVAVHFIGPRPGENYTPRHLNGDKMDSRAENLEWAVRRIERVKRSSVSATKKAGIRAQRAKQLNADPNWREVIHPKVRPGHFWVSRQGKARGLQNVNLTEHLREDGRISVYMKMADSHSNTTLSLDELVLHAFAGERPTHRHRIIHRNGDRTDNRIDNLYWGIPGTSEPQPDPEPRPEPQAAIITPTRAAVTVTTLASYRVGEVEVVINNGIMEPPKGGNAVEQAAALAQIYAEIAKGEGS